MRKCWDKDAVKRPSFQEIVTALRECSMKNPSYAMVGEVNARATAPSGKVYIVNTVSLYLLMIKSSSNIII